MHVPKGSKLYFKHLYGVNTHEWGVVGFPTTQSPTKALQGYRRGDLVLLAVTVHPDLPYPDLWQGYEGKIFAISSLLRMDVRTADVANPDMVSRYPEVAPRWPQATAIDRMWVLRKPASYRDFGSGRLGQRAQQGRGKMFGLYDEPGLHAELLAWLRSAKADEVEVYRSARTSGYQDLLKGAST